MKLRVYTVEGERSENEVKSYLVPIWRSQTGALPDSLMRTVRCENLEVTYRCDKSRPDFRHAGIGDSGHGNTTEFEATSVDIIGALMRVQMIQTRVKFSASSVRFRRQHIVAASFAASNKRDRVCPKQTKADGPLQQRVGACKGAAVKDAIFRADQSPGKISFDLAGQSMDALHVCSISMWPPALCV